MIPIERASTKPTKTKTKTHTAIFLPVISEEPHHIFIYDTFIKVTDYLPL